MSGRTAADHARHCVLSPRRHSPPRQRSATARAVLRVVLPGYGRAVPAARLWEAERTAWRRGSGFTLRLLVAELGPRSVVLRARTGQRVRYGAGDGDGGRYRAGGRGGAAHRKPERAAGPRAAVRTCLMADEARRAVAGPRIAPPRPRPRPCPAPPPPLPPSHPRPLSSSPDRVAQS